MAQIKIVFLMHDVDQFNGSTTDRAHESVGGGSGFEYPTTDDAQSMGGKTTRHSGRTKAELCTNLTPGSTLAKAAFGTKVHANVDAAKTAMGVANMDVSDASDATWALNGDKTELSLTCTFANNTAAESFQTKLEARDPWATEGLVWQDLSKGVWTKD